MAIKVRQNGQWVEVSSSGASKLVQGNTSAEVVDTGTNGHFKVLTEGTERLRIGTNGQIGLSGTNYGTSGQVLASNGASSAPTWASPSNLTVNSATNLAGGAAGSLPYQSAANTTAFLVEPNANDKILSYNNTTNAPVWINQSSIETTQSSNAATAASNAQSTANSAATAASNAQSTANSAATAASGAQSTANSASSAASTNTTNITNLTSSTVTGVAASADDVLGVSGRNIIGVDAGSDRLVYWDNSGAKLRYLTAGTGLTITGTTISAGDGFVAGMIMMWSGSIGSIPTGWVLCNGSNGAPDLRDRFIVGAGSGYNVDATGGSANATLVSHSHTTNSTINESNSNAKSLTGTFRNDPQPAPTGIFSQTNINHNEDSDQGNNGRLISIDATHRHTTDSQGSSATNANLPPYYALAFIMKT